MPLDTEKSRKQVKRRIKSSAECLIDGVEQPVRRPTGKVEQKENYSGKKKRHTSKALVLTNKDKLIIGMSPIYIGSTHDFTIFKSEDLKKLIPEKTKIYVDTGFEGINKECPHAVIRKPKKKPRSRKLNGGEKLGNKIISKKRVRVEHSIGGMKRFQITSQVFRGITHSMDTTFKIAAGLYNYMMIKRGHAEGF